MKKLVLIPLALFSLPIVLAHCPLCTTGAAVGVGIARFYGVDDSIVGLFLGALIVSSALWFNKWLKKRVNFFMQEVIIVLATFLTFVVPFYYGGLITSFDMVKSMPEHHAMLGMGVLGIDRLLFGIMIGVLVVWVIFKLSEFVKEKNNKVLFPYQSIVFMIFGLTMLSILFWILTR